MVVQEFTKYYSDFHPSGRILLMKMMKCHMWQEQGRWCGYLQDYPDHRVYADSFEEIELKLRRVHADFSDGKGSGPQKLPRAA